MNNSGGIRLSALLNTTVLFLFFLILSNTAAWCFDQKFLFLVFGYLALLFLVKGLRIDYFILGIVLYWFAINILYAVVSVEDFNLNRVIGPLFLLGITYMSIKIIGCRFWMLFEKWIFRLTCIALAIFCMQAVFPGVFESLSAVFGRFISDFYKETRPSAWYMFFYTYSPISGLSYIRNSGFMWEPGAFAMVIIYAIVYRWFTYGFRIDKYILVYFIATLSTLSTAGYIAFIALFLVFMVKEKKMAYAFIYILLLLAALPFIFQLDFMTEKINTYMLNYKESTEHQNIRLGSIEYDRFTVFAINLRRTLEYPFGYGIYSIKDYSNNDFVGVNGLASIMRMWGIPGFLFFTYSVFAFLKKLGRERTPIVLLAMLALFITFFSNPVERNPLSYLFVISPFLLTHKTAEK